MDALLWQDKALSLLDQKQYPKEELWYDCTDYRAVVEVLKTHAVQGENFLAISAAYGYCLAALEYQDKENFEANMTEAMAALRASRPESKALAASLDRMAAKQAEYQGDSQQVTALLAEAVTIHRQDVVACRNMNRRGVEIIPDEAKILLKTCSGVFHTGSIGSALGVIRSALLHKKVERVFLCESRPSLEGIRRIATELAAQNVPTTLIPDAASATLMARHNTDIVLIDATQVAATGDLLAAPGAYELAIAAYFHSVPVYAVAFTSQMDLSIPDGSAFPQEDGESDTDTKFTGVSVIPEGVNTWTPRYDVIPNYLLTGMITDKGLLYPPFQETMPELMTKSQGNTFVFA